MLKDDHELLVCFATQTGNCASIAERIYEENKDLYEEFGSRARLLNLSECTVPDFRRTRFLVLACSSTGDGDPPDACVGFWRSLRRCQAGAYLSHLSFALLALGDSNYTSFLGFPLALAAALRSLGASPALQGEADEAMGLEIGVEPFLEDLRPLLRDWLTEAALDDALPPLPSSSPPPQRPKVRRRAIAEPPFLHLRPVADSAAPNAFFAKFEAHMREFGYRRGRLGEMRRLVSRGDSASASSSSLTSSTAPPGSEGGDIWERVVRVPRDLARAARAGDALALLPLAARRHVEAVEMAVKAAFKLTPAPDFVVASREVSAEEVPAHLKGLLADSADAADGPLDADDPKDPRDPKDQRVPKVPKVPKEPGEEDSREAVPPRALLGACAMHAALGRVGAAAVGLDAAEGTETMADALERGLTPSLGTMLRALPPLQPRHYSLVHLPEVAQEGADTAKTDSNSDDDDDDDDDNKDGRKAGHDERDDDSGNSLVDVVVAFTEVPGGVCSPWLAKGACGTAVWLRWHSAASFAPPSPADARPAVLCGVGTGVAPFVAFLEWRQRRPATPTGDWWLYQGCRTRRERLYADEIDEFVDRGTLQRARVATSREGKGQYVQHCLQEDAEELQALAAEGALFYVCGDGRSMVQEISDGIREICQGLENIEIKTDIWS